MYFESSIAHWEVVLQSSISNIFSDKSLLIKLIHEFYKKSHKSCSHIIINHLHHNSIINAKRN